MPKKTLQVVNELISKIRPTLYVCGHAHNKLDLSFGRWADIGGVLGVNAACLSEWNSLHGMPIVIDCILKERARSGDDVQGFASLAGAAIVVDE